MKVRQMYPKPMFQAEDLAAFDETGITVVTIRSIDCKTGAAKNLGEMKIDWFMRVDELKKPIRLNPTAVSQIEACLRADDTDEWIGRKIGMQPTLWPVPDPKGGRQFVHVLNFYAVADDALPSLPYQTDLSGYESWSDEQKRKLAAASRNMLPPGSPSPTAVRRDAPAAALGAERAAKIIVELRARGKTWADLQHECRQAGCPELIDGMLPPECPSALADRARVFCSLHPKTTEIKDPAAAVAQLVAQWAPPVPQSEVIDPATGEVIRTDDIPF